MLNKRKIRDILRLSKAILCFGIYIPHLIAYYINGGGRKQIDTDVNVLAYQVHLKLPRILLLLFFLHNNRYFRVVFYHRLGPVWSTLIGWYRPGDKYFTIGKTVKIGHSFWFAHPYGTVLAADSIGHHFRCIHLTTLGNTSKGCRPTIGNYVSLGANVTIIGAVHIGNNVRVGAGTVIVKDVPDNCVVVGNPARIVRHLEPIE